MLAPQTQFVPPRKGAGLEEHLKWAFGRPPLTCTASTHSMCPPRPKEHPFSGGGKDRLATLEKIIGGEVVSLAMVGVGVGSAALVEWCTINALPNLVNAAGDDPSGPSLARAAQLVVEIAQREAGACAELTGCMLTMCAVNRTRSEVVTCHVGVAGAILFARGKQSSPRLTEDHMLATSAHEQRRLKERGVQLAPAQDAHGGACGPLRSWPGGLTCARIIGNLDREAPGVCAVPSLSIVPVPPGGADLLICSHGVWGELLDTHVASLVRASPCPDTAARLIVESAVQQHTSYYQEGYGVPLDDATVVMLRIGAVRAAPTHGLSEGKGERSRPSAFARLRQKLFPGAGTNGSSTPVCATPSDLSDASIRSGVSLMGAGGGEVWGNAPDSPTLPASPDGTIMEDVELEELDPLDEPGSSLAQQSMGSLAQSMGSLAVGDGSEIHVLRLIGEGASSEVYEGTWGAQEVVVKFMGKQADALSQFQTEVAIWTANELRHPCICSLLRTGLLEERPWMAFEKMAGGPLSDFLRAERAEALDSSLLARIVAEVANGVAHLHEHSIIHRDIKPANVLLDLALRARVSDLGMSTRFGRAEHTAERGTYRQMAPEIVLRRPYDHKVDVYSFGVLMWETLHPGDEPFAGLMPLQAAFAVAMQQTRPPMSLRKEHEGYSDLMQACWDAEPTSRPEMAVVAQATARLAVSLGVAL